MVFSRKSLNISLLLLAVVLGGAAAVILWLPPLVSTPPLTERSFGLYEGRELTAESDANGRVIYVVKDSAGNYLFTIPLKDCVIDSRFRDGKLLFRRKSDNRSGYIDRSGFIAFEDAPVSDALTVKAPGDSMPIETAKTKPKISSDVISTRIPEADPRQMIANHPFSKEASKILSGRLSEPDSLNRRRILNYCEHFRMSYNTRDIDFLRQVFSEDALIIVGNTIQSQRSGAAVAGSEKVRLSVRSKQQYLNQLNRIFKTNKKIDVRFSDFRILRHPTVEGIYGVTLRQRYSSDRYSDDGYLFLLWDFRNPSMPKIHVRTWQPEQMLRQGEEQIGMQDFNLE